MSTAELNPQPVRVSALIKFGRWSFLALGIVYGAFHQNRLSKREALLREEEAKLKPIRDAQLAEEKKRDNEATMKMLNEMFTSKSK